MNKSELVRAIGEECSLSADDSALVVNTFFDCVKKTLLEGNRVEIRGLGSFHVKQYEGFVGRNPRTGQNVTVAPKKLPFFRAGRELKELLNQDRQPS